MFFFSFTETKIYGKSKSFPKDTPICEKPEENITRSNFPSRTICRVSLLWRNFEWIFNEQQWVVKKFKVSFFENQWSHCPYFILQCKEVLVAFSGSSRMHYFDLVKNDAKLSFSMILDVVLSLIHIKSNKVIIKKFNVIIYIGKECVNIRKYKF